jgi:hypothetical protein
LNVCGAVLLNSSSYSGAIAQQSLNKSPNNSRRPLIG